MIFFHSHKTQIVECQKKNLFLFFFQRKKDSFKKCSLFLVESADAANAHCVINKKAKFFLQKKRSKILLSARASHKHRLNGATTTSTWEHERVNKEKRETSGKRPTFATAIRTAKRRLEVCCHAVFTRTWRRGYFAGAFISLPFGNLAFVTIID